MRQSEPFRGGRTSRPAPRPLRVSPGEPEIPVADFCLCKGVRLHLLSLFSAYLTGSTHGSLCSGNTSSVGEKFSGSSKLPTVMSISCSRPSPWKEIGVPHFGQKAKPGEISDPHPVQFITDVAIGLGPILRRAPRAARAPGTVTYRMFRAASTIAGNRSTDRHRSNISRFGRGL